jgi:hypothetical protein
MAFDINDYKRRTARLVWDDLALDEFATEPLDEASLRCLRYMHDVEFHTVCYLRDLLLTPAHADPVVTAFLSFWVYEEYWHGEALAAVLRAHGEPAGDERVAIVRHRLGRLDKVRPLMMTIGSSVAGADFTAVHMTWGAINEWTTQAGYAQLSRRSGHPVLGELLGRIMRQEGRHIDFYASQAQQRLAASPRAQRLTRTALRRFWHPVGAGVMPPEETRFVTEHLFGDEEGLQTARRIDRRIDRLAGLDGLHLIEGAAAAVLSHGTDRPANPWTAWRRPLVALRSRVPQPA